MKNNKKTKIGRAVLSLGLLGVLAIPTVVAHADYIKDSGINTTNKATGYYGYSYTQSSSNVAVAKIKKQYCTIADPNVKSWSSYTTDTSTNGWAQTGTIGGYTTVAFKSQHESNDEIKFDQA